MLDDPQVQKMMKQVAAGVFPSQQLLEVHSEPVFDADGQEALRITLVLTEEAAASMTPEQLTSLLVELHDGLLQKGDERFPLLYYATPSDRGDAAEDE